jgi:hypothetical protein
MMKFKTTSVAQTTNYADKINKQFSKSKSHYVDIGQRLQDTIGMHPARQKMVAEAVKEFQRRNPNIKKWSDLRLCKGQTATLDNIRIDITLQRLLMIMHALKILSNFNQILVMPIQVYEDPAQPGKYVCWDGQHTSVVLYMIAALVLGEDLSKCEIPVVVYQSNLKSEMRECFIALNGDAKLPLDEIDKFQQKVFGVRTDGSKNPDWQLVERKQRYLENAKMFATGDKFGDTDRPGALTRMSEITNDLRYEECLTEYFCKYFYAVCGSSRPVQPKECWMLYEYFQLCVRQGINVTDAYIRGVAESLKHVGDDDFDALKFSSHATTVHNDWWLRTGQSIDGTLRGIQRPEYKVGLTMLIPQIAKNFSGEVPEYVPLFKVRPQDLI